MSIRNSTVTFVSTQFLTVHLHKQRSEMSWILTIVSHHICYKQIIFETGLAAWQDSCSLLNFDISVDFLVLPFFMNCIACYFNTLCHFHITQLLLGIIKLHWIHTIAMSQQIRIQMNSHNAGTKETSVHWRKLCGSAVWHRQSLASCQSSAAWSCLLRIVIPGRLCQDAVGSLRLVLSSTGNPRDVEAEACGSVMSLPTRLSSPFFSMAPCHWWSLLSVKLMLS